MPLPTLTANMKFTDRTAITSFCTRADAELLWLTSTGCGFSN
jgi:hypothetical protein